jgi:hypothetical protein
MIEPKPVFHHDFLGGFLERFKRPNPRVHVRHGHDPIEIVVVIRIGVGRQVEFLAPPFGETAPEEITDGHAIRLLMSERGVQAVQLFQRTGFPVGLDRRPALLCRTSP